FVLTAFRVELLEPDSDAATAVAFARAKSDDSAGGDVGQLLKRTDDGYGARGGWSIDATRDEERLRRQAVFVPGEPLVVKPGTRARIRLGFEGGNVGQALGCFRLSVTGASDPLAAVALRAKTR